MALSGLNQLSNIDLPKRYFIYIPQHAATVHPSGTPCRFMVHSHNPISLTSAVVDSHWEYKLLQMVALLELRVDVFVLI